MRYIQKSFYYLQYKQKSKISRKKLLACLIVDFAYLKGLTGSYLPLDNLFKIKRIGYEAKRNKKKKIRAKISNTKAAKDDNTDTANGIKNSIKKILSTVLITVLFSKSIFIFLPFVSSSGGISAACRIGSYSTAGALSPLSQIS